MPENFSRYAVPTLDAALAPTDIDPMDKKELKPHKNFRWIACDSRLLGGNSAVRRIRLSVGLSDETFSAHQDRPGYPTPLFLGSASGLRYVPTPLLLRPPYSDGSRYHETRRSGTRGLLDTESSILVRCFWPLHQHQ